MNERHAIQRIFGKIPRTLSCEPLQGDCGITGRIAHTSAGILRYHVAFSDGSEACFVGKRKTRLVVFRGMRMLSKGDPLLFLMLMRSHRIFAYDRSALREARLYEAPDAQLRDLMPHFYGSAVSHLTGESLVAMEELSQGEPDREALYPALDAAAAFHAAYFGDAACTAKLLLNSYRTADYRRARSCMRRIFDRLHAENERCFSRAQIDCIHRFIENIHTEFAAVSHRRTLTHNDYCVRNLKLHEGKPIIYDWELACYQNPEHDAVELVLSVMGELRDGEVLQALHYHRETLAKLTGVQLTDAEFAALLRFNTLEYIVNKLSLLRHACRSLGSSDMERLAAQAARLMELLEIH